MADTVVSRGAILATLAALCWGVAIVMSKGVIDSFPPVFLLTVQLIASVVCIWAFIFLRRRPLPRLARADILKFASLGLLEPGLAYLLSLIGLTETTASNATLIYSTEAIMIIILGVLMFGEKPTLRFVVFSVIAVGGLCTALGVFPGADGGSLRGDMFILSGTLVAALYVVLSARFAARIDPVYIVAWQQTMALFFVVLLLPASAALSPQPAGGITASPGVWLLAAFSGVVQYALAFSLYIAALKTISANYAGSFLNLIPLFGLAGAFLFLHETLSLLQLTGASITVLSVTYINLRLQPAAGKLQTKTTRPPPTH